MTTTIDLTQISIDQLDQIEDLATLKEWTKDCTACGLRAESDQVTHSSGDLHSPVMLVGMNPGFCEDATGIPFVGRQELARSRCAGCTHYTECFNWQTGLGAKTKLVDRCQGFTPLPPGTPAHVPPASVKVGPFVLGGVISAGQLLDDVLFALGVDREKLFVTNAALCRSNMNAQPKAQYVNSCSRIRLRTQRLLKPKVIVALGLLAIGEYSPRKLTLAKDHGTPFEYQDQADKYTVVPTYHPSSILRQMMDFPRTSLSEQPRVIESINKNKWALYSDLGGAFNLLSEQELKDLLLPGRTLVDGKLQLRSKG